jgi:hypothetical protein
MKRALSRWPDSPTHRSPPPLCAVCRKEKRHRRRRRVDGEPDGYSEYSGDSSAAMSDTDVPWGRSPALGRSPLGDRGLSPKPSPKGSPSPRRGGRPHTRKVPSSASLEPHPPQWRARSASPSWRSRDNAAEESPGLQRRSPGLLRRAITDSPLTIVRQPRGPDGTPGFGSGRGRGTPLSPS